ncbi:type IV pilus assembly protein PilM [Galbitalea soli]|uniref:Type IV pilus assembly protein PilM n=1 Tax=Galbitalea soli TaxID=1268042 RepID=A0A7C9TRE0_9MICO|nr:type IV pilus assembly protein PilM [Galbitalea soli]NYJ29893.1 type IV pilus assembly protein PilM [Galbitalea soli]
MAKNIVGIDISNSGIRAVEVSDATKARPSVVRYKSVPLPEGAVSRGEVLEPSTVSTALRQLWSTGGFTSREVVLGIGNHRVLARDLTVPKMSIERIRESLPFQVQEMLPVAVEDALLDFYPISETESEVGTMVNGLLVAAVKESVVANVKAAELAGLNPTDVDLIPFALSRVFLRGAHGRGTVAVIEIGESTSTVVIAKDGVPQFVRIIASGGADVTEAIRSELSLTTEQAETAKRALGLSTVGVAVENRPVVEVIYRVAGELLNSIRNTINYFAGTRPQDPVRQIILTGGGSKLIGFAQALGDNTRIPVAAGNPFETITVNRTLAEETARGENDGMVVALGLALGSAA